MHCSLFLALIVSSLLLHTPCIASEPSSDEIPIIGQRFAHWGWSPLLLCQLDLREIDGHEDTWTGRVQELWIRFQTTLPVLEEEEVMPIRLSWVLLEESGD